MSAFGAPSKFAGRGAASHLHDSQHTHSESGIDAALKKMFRQQAVANVRSF